MKLTEIFLFEVGYQVRRVWTWFICLALFVFAILMTRDGTLAEALFDDFFINSPFAIAKTTVTGCLIWLLVGAVIAGEAAARDVATGMHSLTYSLPVRKSQYLAGRFFAALFINALMMLAVQAGIVIAVYLPGVDPELIGPFRLSAYLTGYTFLALPNVLAATAIQFTIALKTGRPMAAYLGSVFLFFMSYILGLFLFLQGRRELANLLDPIGVHFILSDLSHLWTPTEKSWRLISLDGTVLKNRLAWTAFALTFLTYTYFTFQFRHRGISNWILSFLSVWKRDRSHRVDGSPEHPIASTNKSNITRIQPPVRTRFRLQLLQMSTIAWASFRSIATSWAGLALLIAIPMLTILVVIDQMESNGVPLLPSTIRVINELTMTLSSEFSRWIIIPLLIIFFAGELVWRERDTGMAEISDAMPVSEWIPLLGKLFGLGLLLLAFMIVLAIVGVAAQLILNYHEIELSLYGKILFGFQLPEYLLFTVLALVIHATINQKYLGHLAAVFALVVIAIAPIFGLEHNLLVYGAGPSWTYTDMQGFGDSILPWLWFKLYWFFWAMLLIVLTRLFWVRSRENGLQTRLKIARQRIDQSAIVGGALAFGLMIALAGFIYYNTNILNEYVTSAEAKLSQAGYERTYSKYTDTPQPEVTHASLQVEIYPDQRKVTIKGNYQLVNNTERPIETILLSEAGGVKSELINFSHPATLSTRDEEHGQRIYTLTSPLRPGDSLGLEFEVQITASGFNESGASFPVDENASSFSIQNWLPSIGYQKHKELITPADRRRYGLSERPLIAPLTDKKAREDRGLGIRLDVIVGTSENQTAVAPGALKRSWSKSGRRYFHYATDGPIGSEWAVFSAKYEMREMEWQNKDNQEKVVIRMFHHPRHTAHVDRVLRSVRACLDYYSRNFGSYPYSHLTIVERPGNGTGMHADPAMIIHGEGFTQWNPVDDEGSLDLPYAIVAHEMGHQWTVPYAAVEGAPVMSESVAWYYGMKAVEHSLGNDHLKSLLRFMRQPHPYPPIRRGEPLLRGLDPYLSYRRGPFALYAMSEYVGEDSVNQALKDMLRKHRAPEAPLATTLDLFRELQSVTPDSLQYLLHDLFQVNTYWELEAENVTAKKTTAGDWEITLALNARKVVTDSAGVERDVPMNDWIELGAIGSKKNGELGETLYRRKHRVHSGKQVFTFRVSQKPARAGIDPWHLMLDLQREDNSLEVKL